MKSIFIFHFSLLFKLPLFGARGEEGDIGGDKNRAVARTLIGGIYLYIAVLPMSFFSNKIQIAHFGKNPAG